METCLECGAVMEAAQVDLTHYSGLPKVTVPNVREWRCPSCGETELEIPRMNQLHRDIARGLAAKPSRLTSEEIRFLRVWLGFPVAGAFAAALGVTPETVSRWENDKLEMKPAIERLLRTVVLMMPANGGPVEIPQPQSEAKEPLELVAG